MRKTNNTDTIDVLKNLPSEVRENFELKVYRKILDWELSKIPEKRENKSLIRSLKEQIRDLESDLFFKYLFSRLPKDFLDRISEQFKSSQREQKKINNHKKAVPIGEKS